MSRQGSGRLGALLPMVAWMALIQGFSTDSFSSPHTGHTLERLLAWIAPGILARLSVEQLSLLNFLARKSAHVTEYAVLTALVLRCCGVCRPVQSRAGFVVAVAVAALWAVLDEWHQSFVPSRGGLGSDVVWDCGGALVGAAAWGLWQRRRARPTRLAPSR